MRLTLSGSFLLALLSLAAVLAAPAQAKGPFEGKKVLFVNSYHKGYEWSDAIERSIHTIIDPSGAEMRVQYMDTKNHQDEEFKKKAGAEAKAVVDTWKPDVVIVSDDNAVRYLVVPYLKDTSMPVVFTGVNWDAAQYGLPCKNVTGMLEVDSVDQVLKMLDGLNPEPARIAVLAADTEVEHQQLKNHRSNFGLSYVEERYVGTFEEWKKAYVDLQGKADILQLQNNAGIQGWDNDAARAFVLESTRIPSGSIDSSYMSPFAMVLYAKIPEELGEWPAQKALEILGGKSPADIPLSRNVRGQIYVNAPLVKKLGINLPQSVLDVAIITK